MGGGVIFGRAFFFWEGGDLLSEFYGILQQEKHKEVGTTTEGAGPGSARYGRREVQTPCPHPTLYAQVNLAPFVNDVVFFYIMGTKTLELRKILKNPYLKHRWLSRERGVL